MAIAAVTRFTDTTVCSVELHESHKFSQATLLWIPLDHEKCENYIPAKNPLYGTRTERMCAVSSGKLI